MEKEKAPEREREEWTQGRWLGEGDWNSVDEKKEQALYEEEMIFDQTVRFNNGVEERNQICLPIVLQQRYWERHRLHIPDIKFLLTSSEPPYVWIACIPENISISNSVIRAAFDGSENLILGGKNNVISRLLTIVSQKYPWMKKTDIVF